MALQLESRRDLPLHTDHRLCVCLVISAPSGLKYTHVTHSQNTSIVFRHLKSTQTITHIHTFNAASNFNLFSCKNVHFVKCVLDGQFRVFLNPRAFPYLQIHCVWTYGTHTQTLQHTQYDLEDPLMSADIPSSQISGEETHTHMHTWSPCLITESWGTRHSSSTSVLKKRSFSPEGRQTERQTDRRTDTEREAKKKPDNEKMFRIQIWYL